MPSLSRSPRVAGGGKAISRPEEAFQRPPPHIPPASSSPLHPGRGRAGPASLDNRQPIDGRRAMHASDDDFQREMAKARVAAAQQHARNGNARSPSNTKGGGNTRSPSQQRPGSAVPIRSTGVPTITTPQPPPKSNAPTANNRVALVVPPKPSGVVLGKSPSSFKAPTGNVVSNAALVSRSNSSTRPQPQPNPSVPSVTSAPPRVNASATPVVSSSAASPSVPHPTATASKQVAGARTPLRAPLVQSKSAGIFAAKDRQRLPPPQLGDDDIVTPRRGPPPPAPPSPASSNTMDLSMTPNTLQQHQWMDILNYIDAVTIAITHRAKTSPPIPHNVMEAWGDTIGWKEHQKAKGVPIVGGAAAPVGGGVPLSLGGLGPSVPTPRSLGQKGLFDLQRSLSGLLHWFSLLELQHMPQGTSLADAARNLQLLGQDVKTHLGEVQQFLLEAAARSGTQSLAFVKAQSQPSFEDCEHTLNRLLASGRGLAIIRTLVQQRDADKARAVIAEYKQKGNGNPVATPASAAANLTRGGATGGGGGGGPKASPSKFQQKKAMPTPTRPPAPSTSNPSSLSKASAAPRLAFDPSLPIYPPTLVEWLERQWLPAVDDWQNIVTTSQALFTSPEATREEVTKYMDGLQSDVMARQQSFNEMLLPGESVPKLLQAMVLSPGTEASKALAEREECFGALRSAMEKANFVDVAARLKEARDRYEGGQLSAAEARTIKEGQRLLLSMQHVAKVTMSLTTAIGSNGTGTTIATRTGDIRPLLNALTAANQTMLDLGIASDSARCDAAVGKGCAWMHQWDTLTSRGGGDTTTAFAEEWIAYFRSMCAPDLLVPHVPGGAWPPELTILYQRAGAALGVSIEREITRYEAKQQLQRHLAPANKQTASSSSQQPTTGGGRRDSASTTVSVGKSPSMAHPRGGGGGGSKHTPARSNTITKRSGSTSTDLGANNNSQSPPTRLPPPSVSQPLSEGASAERDASESRASVASKAAAGFNTVAIEDLRALVSRGRQLGISDGQEMQQLQRVLESATELRFKIHFDSNIRVLGLAMERVGGGEDAVTEGGGGKGAKTVGDPTKRRTASGSKERSDGSKPRYEPPSFGRAFDRIYTFCTGASPPPPPPSSSSAAAAPLFHTPNTVNFRIRYQDADGDFITVASEEDWRVLLSDHYRGVLQQGAAGEGKTTKAARKIELYCDVPPLPQHYSTSAAPSNTAASSSQQQPVQGVASPFRAQSFVPTVAGGVGRGVVGTPSSKRGNQSISNGEQHSTMNVRGRNAMGGGEGIGGGGRNSPAPSHTPPTMALRSEEPLVPISSSPLPGSSAAFPSQPKRGGGFTVQHTTAGGGGVARQVRSGSNSNIPPKAPTPPLIVVKENDALNEHMRREQQQRQQQVTSTSRVGGGGAGASPATKGLTATAKPRQDRGDKGRLAIDGTDDDGTLSVIEVHATGGGWNRRKGGGDADDKGTAQDTHGNAANNNTVDDDASAYDVRTMQSVATTAIVEEARRLAAGGGGGQQHRLGIGELPPRKSGGGFDRLAQKEAPPPRPASRPPSPSAPTAIPQPQPRTWQEAHGEEYDVHTIMSEETTMTMVQRRAEVKQHQARSNSKAPAQANPSRKRDASPAKAIGPNTSSHQGPAPLSTAELNQRRAALLAQLRKQKAGGDGDIGGDATPGKVPALGVVGNARR